MENKKVWFKNMDAIELLKHYNERKNDLDKTQSEILACRQTMKTLRKREIQELERLNTIHHWISSKSGVKSKAKRI